MTLQIRTFDDLLEIINTHPDWRQKLVKALFPEIDLPKAIQELTEANRLLRAQLGDVEAKLAEIDARLGRMEGRLERMEGRQERMDERLGHMEGRQERMEGRLINVERSVADLKGIGYESEVRAKADAIFGYFLRRGHEVKHEVSLQLDQAEEKGLISGDEYTQVLATDLLWRGRGKNQETTTTLVIEVSWFAEQNDLTRAAARAAILQRLGLATLPVVAAREWSLAMRQAAAQQGVLVVEQFNVDKQSWQSTVAVNGG